MTILGFDSETFRGEVKLLACSNGNYIESHDTDELLDFLYFNGRTAEHNVLWNIGFDISVILRDWVVSHEAGLRDAHFRRINLKKRYQHLEDKDIRDGRLSLDELREQKEIRKELKGLASVERVETAKYRVMLIADKGIRITPRKRRRGQKSVYFFDASQFYSAGYGGERLEVAAQKYLGEGKSDGEEGLSREAIGEVAGYYEQHREAIIRYCVKDCDLTARLFATTRSSFERLGLSFPEHPWSKASISKQHLNDLGCLEKTQERYALLDRTSGRSFWRQSYRGGVFVARTLGRYGPGMALDINSAYPAAMKDFPSLEGAYLVPREHPDFDGAYFKFYRIRAHPSPRLAVRDPSSERLLYVDGGEPREFVVTGPDLEALDIWGDNYAILDSVGVVCPSWEKPLSWLADLYEKKAEVKKQYGGKSAEYWGIKIVLNGTYGLFAQSRPTEGPFTNFIFASYITASCRRELWKKAREVEVQGGTVHMLATDGLTATNYTPPPSSDKLGEWSVEKFTEIVAFGSGIYSKDGDLKRRGLPALTLETLQNCHTSTLSLTKKSPFKLRSSIVQRRASAIGSFRDQVRTLQPALATEEAGVAIPKDLATAPIRDYFRKTWRLPWAMIRPPRSRGPRV